ncbi:MAG: hypothetical protein ACKOW9_05030 [Candidatus Paceibacterota bacterium]
MANRLFSPAYKKLAYPNGGKVLRSPDFRHLLTPRLTGESLPGEVDYDDLIIHRSWRSFDEFKPDQVKYFMFELSQRNPGESLYSPPFYKAVRMLRLTRVPRYLRQSSSTSGPNMVFEQMRDVLAALREQGVLFINLIAKSPNMPLVFAYGVQGVGSSVEEAIKKADEAFAVLEFQLNGTYQQLMHKPISVNEGELISRYQSEWSHLAMARGRPFPASSTVTNSLLDGNRTDIESTNNQLESFIRGMSDKSFLLTLVTVPLSPAEITSAWRNITQKLTEVRSETTGSRVVSAGVAFPLTMGTSQGDTSGATHNTASTYGTTTSDARSESVAQGITNTTGISNQTSAGQSSSLTDSYSLSQNHGQSVGESASVSSTQGISSTNTVGSSATQSVGTSMGQNWNNSIGQSLSSSLTQTDGWNQSQTNSVSETVSAGNTQGDSSSAGSSSGSGSNVGGGVPGILNGGTNTSSGTSLTNSVSNQNTVGVSQSGGSSSAAGISSSRASGVSQGLNFGESFGGNIGTNSTASNSVSQSTALSSSQTVGSSQSVNSSTNVSAGASQGQSLARSESLSQSVGTNRSEAQSLSSTEGSTRSVGSNQAFSDGYAVALSRSNQMSGTFAAAPNFGVAVSRNTFDAAKQYIGDLLEAQMRRYDEGIKSGAFLYQMFLVTPDRDTLVGGAGLLKSAFWGAGNSNDKLPQPFHTIVDFDEYERRRLLSHALAYTSYRKREPVTELIEPFLYSSYLTPSEGAAFVHPPVVEGPGLLAVHDSMPVTRIPIDRQEKDLSLGYVVNAERGIVSDIRFGLDVEELTHTLIAGVTGSGKTTTLMKLLSDAVKVKKDVVLSPTLERPYPVSRPVYASVLALDWMRNMRNLASIPELTASGRFKFFSLLKPELGKFRWNPLEVPANGMSATEWLNAQADNFTASFSLGEYGRSLIAELLTDLFSMNRLEDVILRPEVVDDATGAVVRPAIILPKLNLSNLPKGAVAVGPDGRMVANVFTYPDLSRCVSMAHLATMVAHMIEKMADPNAGRLYGTEMRNRLQSLWRRMQYFAPGGQYADMLGCDPDLNTKLTLSVNDLVNPDEGLVTVLETDGLDMEARRLILGSILLAIYRFGLYHGDGVFDHNGKGPGCFIVMEESHELFGESGRNEDAYSAATRTHLYESMFRRVRALGLRLIAVAQQPSVLPEAVTANISTVIIHKVRADDDRKKAFSLLNWILQIGQQQREYRYLGEMPIGHAFVRLDSVHDFTEAAPVQIKTEQPLLHALSDNDLKLL